MSDDGGARSGARLSHAGSGCGHAWCDASGLDSLADARLFVRVFLFSAPFLAAIGATYWLLLREHDINYYLNARPPVFIAACVIVAVLALSLAIVLARKLVGLGC